MYIRPPSRLDRPDAPVSRWRRARRRLMRPMVIGSLLVHLLILGLVLFLPRPPPRPDSPPESSFDIVLDGGAIKPSSQGDTPKPPAAAPGNPSPVDGPLTTISPPPSPTPSPDPATPPPPNAAPSPEPPAPDTSPPRVDVQPPRLPAPVPVPEPDPEPLPLPPVPPAPPRPRVYARPVPRPSPRNPSGFPAPQDWSFSGGLPAHPSQQGASGSSQMAGPSMPAPKITGAQLGRDWIAAYSAWVQAHLYYPEQAAANGEDGDSEVVINIDRYGKVLAVELVGRSGSQWLDLETTGMFRGAHVPAFPPGTKEDTATVDQTIHYILRRR